MVGFNCGYHDLNVGPMLLWKTND